MSERGANQGSCAHSCRWSYKLKIKLKDNTEETIEINDQNKDLFNFFLEEEIRPGQLMPFEEDMHGSYILNAKDLCLMPKLNEYLEIGINSLKVEGRNKSEFYAGSVARIYRLAIDDYYQDPKNWDHQKYMAELDAISNRGYSLAFHDGRLTNLAHDYNSTKSSSIYEYIARVRCWEGDDIIIDIKNRLAAGDVLEFMSPYRREVILLRLYEFENAKTAVITEVVNQSQKNEGVRLKASIFHEEDINELKKLLPELTLIRKDKNLNFVEESRKSLHKAAQKLEITDKNEHIYQKKKDKYLDNRENNPDPVEITTKSAKIGLDGCCGKGCNGCLIFWNDNKYAKARELMKKKKIGEML
jgi:putative protease